MKKYLRSILAVLFSVHAIGMLSQVTIGSTDAPAIGATLDLKSMNPPDGNTDPLKNETSKMGGLILPRVNLKDLNTLDPFVATPNDLDVKKKHTGLVVYNVKDNSAASLKRGVYYWDGQKWNILLAGEIITSPWFKVGTKGSSKKNTDDSYLNAKAVVGGTGIGSINAGEMATLTVSGGDASINGITVGKGRNALAGNTAIGFDALSSINTGNKNTAIGFSSLKYNNLTSDNIAVGAFSLTNAKDINGGDIAIGANTVTSTITNSKNIILGHGAEVSGISTTKINVANVLFGVPALTPNQAKVGIGTDDPKATLHVYGYMKFTNAPPISGGSVMTRDNNGNIGKTQVAPRLFTSAEVLSGNSQVVGSSINSGNVIPVTWSASDDFTKVDIAKLKAGSDNEIEFTRTESGNYEISGYICYNPHSSSPGSYISNIGSAQTDWLITLNVLIQKYNTSLNRWETLTGALATWTASAMGMSKLISVPPTIVDLSTGDTLRMAIQKPSGKNHNNSSAAIESIIAGLGFTKGFKLINL